MTEDQGQHAGTAVIVGAGPQLGLAVARRFARAGHDVALLARTQTSLDEMCASLRSIGVRAEGFRVDLRDGASVRRTMESVEEVMGPVEVLSFSPAPAPTDLAERPFAGPVDVTVENVLPEIELWTFGAINAIGSVLPGMVARGSGTIMVTTGAGSGPMIIPMVANVQIATAGLRNWMLTLQAVLRETGVYAVHVAVAAEINATSSPEMAEDVMAEAYWKLHVEREVAELVYPDVPRPDDQAPELAAKNRPGLRQA